MMKTRFNRSSLLATGSALLTSFALLTGCSDAPLPVDQKVFDGLHDKSEQSYALLPILKKADPDHPDASAQYTGRFWAVIKSSEMTNSDAINENGEQGTMKCSTYRITRLSLNQTGDLVAEYSSSRGRYCRTSHDLIVKPQNNKMMIPLTSGYNGCYGANETLDYLRTYSQCKFTPK